MTSTTIAPPGLMNTYARLPVSFVRGEGVWLEDAEGRRYLDALSGIGVCNLGHAHPAIAEALCRQATELVHTSNLYRIPQQETLAARLCGLTDMTGAFFCNSGAEAVEAAIKIARLHGHRRGIETPGILVAEGSFHGRTLATLSATGNRRVQAGFEPLVQGFIRFPFDDETALLQIAETRQDIAAILVEPIQGEGGIRLPSPGHLQRLREICDARGWLLILDEIQSGLCRTGRWFAWQHEAARPDVMTLAKALGNGLPIGACLARGEAAGYFEPGHHGSTFGGNPLVCSVASTVLDLLSEGRFDEQAADKGRRLVAALRSRLDGHPHVREIRGRGLMIGIELTGAVDGCLERALDEGLLVSLQAGRVVRLLPPLVIDDEQTGELVDRLCRLVDRLTPAG